MNMCLMGLPDAADEFLQAYEQESGRKVENLGFWEMAAAARPMDAPGAWQMEREIIAERFQKFLEEAILRT
jgi:hypothetical protein